MENWIKVSDRLPLEGEAVYAYTPRESVAEAIYLFIQFNHVYGFRVIEGVTHWMPRIIPEPPKD